MKTCIDCGENLPLSSYYKNKKMKDGHLNSCKDCRRTEDNKYKKRNRNILYRKTQQWKKNNTSKVKTYMVEYRNTNREAIKASNKAWIEENRERYRIIKNVCNAQRRANKKCAFVKWANKQAIHSIYKQSQELTLLTGIQHHVDHIVPLVSALVCGLHCEDNLRVITATENISKSNNLVEDIVCSI